MYLKITLLVIAFSVLFHLQKPIGKTNVNVHVDVDAPSPSSDQEEEKMQEETPLQFDYYRDSCPHAESIVRSTMIELFVADPCIAPQILRLVFHDCIVGGCDASVLLNETSDGSQTEREAPPNLTLKGFDAIELIKSRLEAACPATVSCADTLVLAAREGVFLVGGPFYPLYTGRRDSLESHFIDWPQIPFPTDDIATILQKFKSKDFNEKEVVTLLGSHRIGIMSCQFFADRMDNNNGTGRPDRTLNPAFMPEISAACNSTSPSFAGFMVSGSRFNDSKYYRRVLNGSVPLFSDQQLMASHITAEHVKSYATDRDGSNFRRDFARAMVKLSNLGVMTGSNGTVRVTCSKI